MKAHLPIAFVAVVLVVMPLSGHALGQELAAARQDRSVTAATSAAWVIERADAPRMFSDLGVRSVALDSDDHPHVAYGGDFLYYASFDGAEWEIQTVDDSWEEVGSHASLVLDRYDRPHISYYNGTNGDLRYAHYDGEAWLIETVDDLGDVGKGSSVAVDQIGRPHISYTDAANAHLKYAWWDGSLWQVLAVDCGGSVREHTSLALDRVGRPHISYADSEGGRLKHAWYDGGAWQSEMVDDGGVSHSSLSLDVEDRPHVSYVSGSELRYAHHDGAAWQTETVDRDQWGWMGEPSLVLGEGGEPHISYTYTYKVLQALRYAYRDDEGWQKQTVQQGVCLDPSLALDSSDRPYISHHSGLGGVLKLAYRDGVIWQIKTVDTNATAGRYSSLVLGDSGRPHVSYQADRSGYHVKYAYHDGVAWQTETVDNEGSWYTSLAVDAAGRPHISYYDFTNDDLKYAYHDGITWVVETVDNDGDVGQFTSLAVDAADRPHISYYDSTNGDLKYAYRDGEEWRIETVDGEGDVGGCTALELDSLGRPHISYCLHHPTYGTTYGFNLKYAWHNGADWQIEVVDSDEWTGTDSSLALDELDRPHISYCLSQPSGINCQELRYISFDGTDWQMVVVDSGGNTGSDGSLALDGDGQPHISYHDWDNGDLKYVYRDGADWRIETVDSEGIVGWDTSLALDAADQPHITYFDYTNWDLKYAWLMPPLSLDKRAEPQDGVRSGDTLTYTLTLSSPGASARLWDPLPSSVQYITGSVTPPGVYDDDTNAIVWQGELPIDTVQVIRFQVIAGITSTAETSLLLPIVNTAWLTDTAVGTGVSAASIVNGQYTHLPLILRSR